MKYVQIGTEVIYLHEKVNVINQHKENGMHHFILDTVKGQRYVYQPPRLFGLEMPTRSRQKGMPSHKHFTR